MEQPKRQVPKLSVVASQRFPYEHDPDWKEKLLTDHTKNLMLHNRHWHRMGVSKSVREVLHCDAARAKEVTRLFTDPEGPHYDPDFVKALRSKPLGKREVERRERLGWDGYPRRY